MADIDNIGLWLDSPLKLNGQYKVRIIHIHQMNGVNSYTSCAAMTAS